MKVIQDGCTGCAYCVLTCPQEAIVTDGWARIVADRCTNCNLCYYACPNDCFVPDVPLKPYRPDIETEYDVVIVGAGIGGLMAATALAQAGRKVAVFEQLGFPGGRYTEIDYKGIPVTTAAWTSLGTRCNIGRFLTDLGIDETPEGGGLRYVSLRDVDLTEQFSIRFTDGRHFHSLVDMIDSDTLRAWLRAIARGRRLALDDVSINDYATGFIDNHDLLATINAIAATASSINSHAMPASEYVQITLDTREAGVDFGVPMGGVRSIIDALVFKFKAAGGQLFLHTPVERILVQDGRGVGLQLIGDRRIAASVIVHNAGPGRLIKLVGAENLPTPYLERLKALKGADCAAIVFATRRPLIEDAPMLMTPGCRRVVGIYAPAVLDPGLKEEGNYVYDAFLPLGSHDRKAELALALDDLRALFPDFDDVLIWHVPMFFLGTWPGTESGQTFGQVGDGRLVPNTPIEGLYLAGMDVQGSGAAGDLIPVGVRRLLNELGCAFPAS